MTTALHLWQSPECSLRHYRVGGVQTEENSAAHHGAVHQTDDGHAGAGGDGVEEVLGAVDVDKVQTVSLIDRLLPLPPNDVMLRLLLTLHSSPVYDISAHQNISSCGE